LKKPTADERKEIRRLILEKLVMGRHWGMNYIALRDIPKGLPKAYSTGWYLDEIEQLTREGLLMPYKKAEPMLRLNLERKREIESLVGKTS